MILLHSLSACRESAHAPAAWLCGLALLCVSPPASAQDYFETAKREYERYLTRPSLNKRTVGREKLAETRDDRALRILIRSYTKPEAPKDYVRYLIATIVMRYFREDADPKRLAIWRKKHKKPEDAWMWYLTLRKRDARGHAEELMAIARGRDNPFVRAAALVALHYGVSKHEADEDLARRLTDLLVTLPKKPLERALVIEAVASILLKKKREVRGDTWRPICRALIQILGDDSVPRRTQVVLSRYLAEVFSVPHLGFEPKYWLLELDKIANRGRSRGNTVSASFFGIRSMGDHLCYVIDASDSMLKEFTDAEREALGVSDAKPEGELEKGAVPTAKDLDWSRIETRFDVAREFLRVSLATLNEEQRFSIVLFGDDAETLAATPGMVPASRKNVRRAIAELDQVQGGGATHEHPDGRLRGFTNLHGGVRLAFSLTHKGATKTSEYADAKSMLEGCDSIFLVSDGAPSADDWRALDTPEEHDKAGNPETGAKQTKSARMWFPGPFGTGSHYHLLTDIERLNMFRRVEIHCVGIGEANADLLDRIARMGHGKTIRLSSKGGKKR